MKKLLEIVNESNCNSDDYQAAIEYVSAKSGDASPDFAVIVGQMLEDLEIIRYKLATYASPSSDDSVAFVEEKSMQTAAGMVERIIDKYRYYLEEDNDATTY